MQKTVFVISISFSNEKMIRYKYLFIIIVYHKMKTSKVFHEKYTKRELHIAKLQVFYEVEIACYIKCNKEFIIVNFYL